MPKKKAQPNGFYFFMKEVKDEEEAKGIRHDMVSIQSIAGPRWQLLSPEDKSYYNQMAKDHKAIAKNDKEHKYTSLGTSIAQVDSQERERQEREQLMINTIHNDCSIELEALKRKPFYLCHVNYQYKVPNTDDVTFYAPCEIALIEFTLNDGITNELNMIVDAGPLPMGFRGECNEWAKDTHGIYHSSRDNKTKLNDMVFVYSSIVKFLKKETNSSGRSMLPPIYTMRDSLNHHYSLSAVESCMTFLCNASRSPRNLFRIFKLPNLFHKLMEIFDPTGAVGFTLAVLEGQIQQDKFGYAEGIACDYHTEIDRTQFCSLSMVKRWMFTITDFVCKRANVAMVAGKHLPSTADIDQWENVESKRSQKSAKEQKGWITEKFQELEIDDDEAGDEELNRAERMIPPRNTKAVRTPAPSVGVWTIAGRGRGNPM
ncbi:Protein maelstrom [Nesidiocoris tenuis]|uniref:Protein maelstrom n=1 Tax=Nesidiocoris tenuis TaxID=355587 RepID=A0ABN7BBC8_9HEMI|nr:Protein maelstrom [Nesidiocoris tenuis]